MSLVTSLLAVALAAVLAASSVLAVQPEEAQPGAVQEPLLVGREQSGRTFRKPGTLLHQARHPPRQVDAAELRQRKIEQVTGRLRHTQALSPREEAQPDLQSPPASGEEPSRPAGVEGQSQGLRAWHVLVFSGLTVVTVIVVVRLTGRRRW